MKNLLGVISGINIFVHDYDEAIAFYQGILCFELIEDMAMGTEKRWVTLKPNTASQTQIILSKAQSAEKKSLVGKQAGSSVLMILTTPDFERTYQHYIDHGVTFSEAPRREPYGKVVIFQDLYGNKFDLIEPAKR